jgi:mannose-6-phosphate isomerase-like protein (cupin superfamily)
MEVINRDDCPAFVTKDTSEIREIMAYRNSSCERMSLAEATLYPSRATERHRHPRSEEIYYVLKGSGRMFIEGEYRDIGEGDAILIPPGAVHQTWNTAEEPLVFLCLCAPAYEHEDTVIIEEA